MKIYPGKILGFGKFGRLFFVDSKVEKVTGRFTIRDLRNPEDGYIVTKEHVFDTSELTQFIGSFR